MSLNTLKQTAYSDIGLQKQVRKTEERTADLGMTEQETEAKMQAERKTKGVVAIQINTKTRTETERVIAVVKRKERELTEIVEKEGGMAAKLTQKIRTNQLRGTVMSLCICMYVCMFVCIYKRMQMHRGRCATMEMSCGHTKFCWHECSRS